MLDLHTTLSFLFRWFHFIFGITWIGLLYFFNFVNGPTMGKLDGDAKKKVVPELMPRALFFFRWGAMLTVIAGYLIIVIQYFIQGSGMTGPSGLMSTDRGLWITFGMLFGTIMWFNVWFIIWPAQKKIIPAVKAGQAPPAGLPMRAANASKLNTYLSVPLLFFMGAGSGHYATFSYPVLIVAILLGFGIAKCFYVVAGKVTGM